MITTPKKLFKKWKIDELTIGMDQTSQNKEDDESTLKNKKTRLTFDWLLVKIFLIFLIFQRLRLYKQS